MNDETIKALVVRLSRADAFGGDTIERAAILAEGSDCASVVAWILARGGTPETAVAAPSTSGLHSSLSAKEVKRSSAPLRYTLPAGLLA
ncbi:MAG: hypothetical protein ACR2OB_06400 [Solirubrobacteraceae bacterium]